MYTKVAEAGIRKRRKRAKEFFFSKQENEMALDFG